MVPLVDAHSSVAFRHIVLSGTRKQVYKFARIISGETVIRMIEMSRSMARSHKLIHASHEHLKTKKSTLQSCVLLKLPQRGLDFWPNLPQRMLSRLDNSWIKPSRSAIVGSDTTSSSGGLASVAAATGWPEGSDDIAEVEAAPAWRAHIDCFRGMCSLLPLPRP